MSLHFSVECNKCGKQVPLYESIEGGTGVGCFIFNHDYEASIDVEIQLPWQWRKHDDGTCYCPECQQAKE